MLQPILLKNPVEGIRSIFSLSWTTMTLNKQLVGNIGLYYCCYRLSQHGWNVMPTSRNARGVDIIAYNSDATRYIGIQVKSLSKKNPVPLGNSLDKVIGDFWIIVHKVVSSPTAFILLPSEIRNASGHDEKDGNHSYWLSPKFYDQEMFREAWERMSPDCH